MAVAQSRPGILPVFLGRFAVADLCLAVRSRGQNLCVAAKLGVSCRLQRRCGFWLLSASTLVRETEETRLVLLSFFFFFFCKNRSVWFTAVILFLQVRRLCTKATHLLVTSDLGSTVVFAFQS